MADFCPGIRKTGSSISSDPTKLQLDSPSTAARREPRFRVRPAIRRGKASASVFPAVLTRQLSALSSLRIFAGPILDIKGAIESKMRLPVKMENAANACLIAELTFGRLDGIRNIILVTISEGVGTGIFANGHLITGDGGRAGEFGHAPIDPNGPQCACGRRGCWEVFASCRAALRYYRELQPKTRDITFHELLRIAEDGNPQAATALEKQAKEIGRGFGLMIAGLSPSMILVAGEITGAWPRFGPVIVREAAGFTVAGPPPRILPAHEGEIARLRGAAALVFQRHWPDRDPADLSSTGPQKKVRKLSKKR